MTRQEIGIRLVVAACALLVYIALSAPVYARAHPHLDPVLLAEYARPWPLALTCALAIAMAAIAIAPLRRGERWSFWTLLSVFAILVVTRLATDPRCLVVLDPHQHGCHSFMIAIVLGVVGLVLARR